MRYDPAATLLELSSSEMLDSSSFHFNNFNKTKNMPRDYHDRKLTRRHRFRDVSHMKLMDIIKSLRRRRFHKDVSRRSSSTHSSPPFANHDLSPVQQPPLSRYCSDAASLLSITEDFSSGMSTSSSSPEAILSDLDRRHHFSSHPLPTLPTSPSVFHLRSASTNDYLVEQLERNLGRLRLGDVDHVSPKTSSRDTLMDVSPQRTIYRRETSSHRTGSERNVQHLMPSPHDQNVVPMILITSVDAKHAKPLPPSDHRPSRTPFGPSNLINHHTNLSHAVSERKTLSHDDPFTTQPSPHRFAYPPADNNLTFRLPSIQPLAEERAYAPETPTPMCCDHLGDCSGDLWEILHPPLVVGRFTLPPFTLPSLSTGLFGDAP